MTTHSQAGERALAAVLRDAVVTRVRRATETPFNIIIEAELHEPNPVVESMPTAHADSDAVKHGDI